MRELSSNRSIIVVHAGASIDHTIAKTSSDKRARRLLPQETTQVATTWRQYQPFERPARKTSRRSPAIASSRTPELRCSSIQVASDGGSLRVIKCFLVAPETSSRSQKANK